VIRILLAFIIYLPYVETSQPQALIQPRYGLAMAVVACADLSALNVDLYHTWGPRSSCSGADFVPMLWSGLPEESLDPGYSGWILVMNEPDNPRQLNISPAEAASRMATTRAHYPNAELLCCGTLSYHPDWLAEFVSYGQLPDLWHYHAFVEGPYSVADIQAQLAQLHAITGGDVWITEYAVMDGDLADFQALTEWMSAQPWITVIMPYTNRQVNGEWWAIDPRVELVSPEGGLTPTGAWFRDFR
jgi:hypothetical protein